MPWESNGDWREHPEGPEERLHRELMEQHDKDCDAVERLLASLRPYDSIRTVIPWALLVKWNLPHRAYPIEPT